MEANGEMPDFVAKLPATFRRQIKKQCGGDWRRVTCDARGSVTVHNQPQRDLLADVLAPEEPEPAPPRQLRTSITPKTATVDTSSFTRLELPVAGPPKKRARKTSAPSPPPPEQTPAVQDPKPSPALFANPAARRTAPARPVVAPLRDHPRQVPPAAAPEAPAFEAPVEAKKRSGVPRTSVEMLKRLLDLGCKFQRLPATDYAKVYYRGHLIDVLRCGDGLDREAVAGEYHKVCDILRTRGWLTN